MSAVLEISGDSSGSLAAGGTTWGMVGFGANGVSSTTEANVQVPRRAAGTFSGLRCRAATNNTTGGSTTFRFRIAAGNGNQSVSVTTGTTGEFTDASNSDSVTAGQLVAYQITVGTGGSLGLTGAGVLFAASSNTVARLVCSTITQTMIAGGAAGQFYPPAGANNSSATEADSQFKVKSTVTMQNLFAFLSANTCTATYTIRNRIATANGTMVLSITTLQTGLFEDTSHSDSVTSGQVINYNVNVGAGSNSGTLTGIGCELSSTGNLAYCCSGNNAGLSLARNTTFFMSLGCRIRANATESAAQLKGTSGLLQNLECSFSANTIASTSTMRMRADSGNLNGAVSITASTSGYFEDASNTDVISVANQINFAFVMGTGSGAQTATLMFQGAKIGVSFTSTQTQTAVSRIQATSTKTQSAVSRVQITSTKTQSAVSRLQITTTKTQSALSRVTILTTKTEPAVGRIQATATKTQAALSRIQATATQTQPGVSRVQVSATKTQLALARLTISTSRTQTGQTRITGTNSATQPAVSRIRITTSWNQSATARVQVVSSQTQSARSRLTVVVARTQSATTRLTILTSHDQAAVARVGLVTNKSQSALGRVQTVTVRTQSGLANITTYVIQSRQQSAVSRIQTIPRHDQPAIARITSTVIYGQPALARIAGTASQYQTGIARIILPPDRAPRPNLSGPELFASNASRDLQDRLWGTNRRDWRDFPHTNTFDD